MGHAMFVCCCRGFLNPNGEGSVEYYEVLDVEANSSPAKIKSAWKKKSLKYHPDKLAQSGKTITPEDQEVIQKINEAYEVLYDPERRKLYNELGANGLRLVEHPETLMNPETMAELFENADAGARCNVFLVVLVLVGFFLLFPILFSLKCDGDISAPWTVVWFPLWIVYGLGLLFAGASVLAGPSKMPEDLDEEEKAAWEDPAPLSHRVMFLVYMVCWVLWQILLCAQLDDDIDWDYTLVLLPFFICELINFGTLLSEGLSPVLLPANFEEMDEVEKSVLMQHVEAEVKLKAKAREDSFWYIVRGVQVLLICLKVDGSIDASWWTILCPLWVYYGSLCCLGCKGLFLAGKFRKDKEGEVDEEELQQEKAEGVGHCVGCCLPVIFVVMLAVRLTPSMDNFSIFWFTFPLFLCSCCVLCTTCVVLLPRGEVEIDESDPENPMDAHLLPNQIGQQTPNMSPVVPPETASSSATTGSSEPAIAQAPPSETSLTVNDAETVTPSQVAVDVPSQQEIGDID